MPVPVPCISRSPPHPVIKQPRRASVDQVLPLQHLSRTLPVSPTGPPPSFGTREQWINSLPSWRRTKPRRIWEDDAPPAPNPTSTDNMILATDPAESRALAAMSVSPIHVLFQSRSSLSPSDLDHHTRCADGDGDADDEMSSDCSFMDLARYDSDSHHGSVSPSGCDYMCSRDSSDGHNAGGLSAFHLADGGLYNVPAYERGVFTPVFEEDSAIHEVASSPLEPVTPFGQFVDRAIAATQQSSCNNPYPPAAYQPAECQCAQSHPNCTQSEQSVVVQQMAPGPNVELIQTPAATDAYRKLAEPLSTWIAEYVWKVCTTGMSLHAAFSPPKYVFLTSPFISRSSFSIASSFPPKFYPSLPPTQLATSVHGLLLSTLLQPSAVFLGLWYIIRLPVFFNAIPLSPEYAKENQLRLELFGHTLDGSDRDRMESDAPFKLIVLGLMLANKWLDDHTFSNKTWSVAVSHPYYHQSH